jgi:hypothetical protein
MSGRREDFGDAAPLPNTNGSFDAAVQLAESAATDRLFERQANLEGSNEERLVEERAKRERFFDYRAQAAADKLAANRRTYARLAASEEESSKRILPVWAKNVETAERMVETVEEERRERLAELEGKDQVSAQQSLYSASFVLIDPDPQPLFDQVEAELPPGMFIHFRRLSRPVTTDRIEALVPEIAKRRKGLLRLAQTREFNVRLAVGVADALARAIEDVERYSPEELNLLYGAVGYFLELEDEAHDLKSPDGFNDDAQVANIVLEVVGRPELRVDRDFSRSEDTGSRVVSVEPVSTDP